MGTRRNGGIGMEHPEDLRVYQRALSNGDSAIALFNLDEDLAECKIPLDGEQSIRDVWSHEDMGVASAFSCKIHSHCVRLFRLSKP